VKRPAPPRSYALPRLFDESTAITGDRLEMYCPSTIRAAWGGGGYKGRGVQAAREHLSGCRLTLADIAAIARCLADYNKRTWPPFETTKKIDWLYTGAGCCERIGTEHDAHVAAWPALSAALSIIVEAPPLESYDDASALLSTLNHTGWRHVPRHQQKRAAQRLSRFVVDSITEARVFRQTY
jgi:hypothetical protein